MSDQVDSARLWKLSTLVLGVACAGLLAFILVRSPEAIDPSVAAGKITKAPPKEPERYGPAPVSLRKYSGPEQLIAEAKKAMEERLSKAGELTYTAAGVKGISVDTTITDRSKVSEKDTEVEVSVQLLVTKQPGNNLLASISATGAAGLGSGASERFIESAKVQVLQAAADTCFNDLVATLETSPASEDDEED